MQYSRAIAVQSGTGTVIRLLRGLTHPDYTGSPLGLPDVGLFTLQQVLPAVLPLAPADSIMSLGDPIQIVGFPGDVDTFLTVVPGVTVAQATSLSGAVTARRSHDETEAVTPDSLDVYQHQGADHSGHERLRDVPLLPRRGHQQRRHRAFGRHAQLDRAGPSS
ncbi:MAG: hypothetical protein H0V12_04315 [Chloroflexi bacterium]|nr:hypothetical protein [Chloroflexota bacterium]